MREEAWATGWDTALQSATRGVAPVIEERRGTTIRDTRAVARRLGASAVMLFSQRGFDEVTVSEIAAHAGVTSRTFFRYFPSKETVLLDIYDQTNSRLMELIETAKAQDGEILPILTEAVVQWCDEYGKLFAALQPIAEKSKTVMAALLIRTTDWEEHLAEALSLRFPGLDPADAKVWGYTAMAMMRLLQQNAGNAGTNYADAARDVFGRLESLMTGRGRSAGHGRRARRAG